MFFLQILWKAWYICLSFKLLTCFCHLHLFPYKFMWKISCMTPKRIITTRQTTAMVKKGWITCYKAAGPPSPTYECRLKPERQVQRLRFAVRSTFRKVKENGMATSNASISTPVQQTSHKTHKTIRVINSTHQWCQRQTSYVLQLDCPQPTSPTPQTHKKKRPAHKRTMKLSNATGTANYKMQKRHKAPKPIIGLAPTR